MPAISDEEPKEGCDAPETISANIPDYTSNVKEGYDETMTTKRKKRNFNLRKKQRSVMTDDGKGYDDNSKNQREVARNALLQYPLDWISGEKVLDIGCASGGMTKEFLRMFPHVGHVTGIDVSPDMIKDARNLNAHPCITYHTADIGDLSTLKGEWRGKFDKVISFNAMHWVQDQSAALNNISWLLKPGGQLLLVMVGKSHQPTIRAVERVLYADKWWDYCNVSV